MAKTYVDLIAWQKAMAAAKIVYEATALMPVDERFGLIAQMRRAAVSIPANIAEGQGRRTKGEFLNHLSIAYGSIRELETHAMLARDLGLLSEETVAPIMEGLAEVGRLVNGLANSLGR